MTLQRTPLYDWHVRHQARMVPFGGWEMPVQYASVVEEHKAVRTAAGLFDISHMARLEFRGADALGLLELVFTNSVGTMKNGQVRYGLICNESGGILDDVLVYRWADGYSMVVNAANRAKIAAWLDRHAAGRDVHIQDQTDSTAMIALQGPRAVELVRERFAADATALRYYHGLRTAWRGTPCVVSRTGYTGEDGFEVSLPAEQAEGLWEEWRAAGAVPCGLGARDSLRLEAGMPLYGHELSEAINPIQAGLAWAVKLDKGAFLGREHLKNPLHSTVRVGLVLEGKRAGREGCAVVAAGVPVGTITSGSYAPWLEQSIAMAYVNTTVSKPGTQLAVDVRGSLIPAQVVPLPFYQRKQ